MSLMVTHEITKTALKSSPVILNNLFLHNKHIGRKKTGEEDEDDQAESEDEAEDEAVDDEAGPEIKEPVAREIDDLITPNHIV